MSDLRLPRLAARVIERTSRQPRGAMTDYERELDPIYDVEMQEELRKRRRLQPLQKIFDILQIGQYVSANVADEIANAILYSRDPSRGNPWEPGDILQAVIDGITGQRKGSYENVLRDTLQVGTQKILPNAPEGTWRANVDYADLLGFIGDVALDPLTYVTFGGSSKGARIAADAFADDAVRLLGKQLAQNPEQLAKITRGKWTQEALQAATGADDVTKAFRQIMRQNDDLGRLFSQTYAEAQKRALNRTAAQLPGLAEDIVGRGAGTRGGIDDILRKAGEGAYEHAGERFKLRVLGKEVGIGEATQLADWRRRSWETFTGFLKQQPGVVNVRNAIWGAMNRGIVGEVKRVMGIRNPYQKYLRSLEREAGEFAVTDASVKLLDEGVTPIFKLSEPEQVAVRDLLASRETAAKAALVAGDARTVAAAASPIVVDPKIAASADQLRSVIDSWQQRANEIAQELGESPLTYYQEYIPEVFRFRSGSAIQRMGREYTFSEQMTKESNLMQFVFGVDKDTADMVVKNNLSGFSTDLRELMAAKALQQAKIENRYRMVQTFKEFGIDMNDFPAHMKSQIQVGGNQVLETPLKMGGRDITQLGLRNIDHPALQNYLFDYDVAEIFDRALKVTSTDRTQIGKMFSAYMSWWKGMVLLNSGYTLRNFYSNTMTQFLRHGPRAFNPKEIEKSIAATLHIMKKTDPKNLGRALESIGKNESWLESMLNTRIGPRLTLRDLSEQGYQRGVISENVFGFDAKDIVEKVSGKTKQPIRLVARKVNTFVENIPRFQSFLIDYVDNVGAEAAEESVLKWSAQQARQWFLDYGDLTQFEQKVMKKVIPFYTWIRKNLANQINGVALYPELYGLIPKIENAVKYENPEYDPALIPEWMRNEAMFALSEPAEGRLRMFRPDFAFQDLNLLPFVWEEGKFLPNFSFGELKNELINATAPWIRDVASRMTTEHGYNYFYREELGETGDAPYLMRLFLSRPGTIALVDGVARLLGSEDGAKLSVDENGKLQMDAEMAQTLESFLPVLRQAEMLFMLPTAVIPGFEQALEQTLKAYDDYDAADDADRQERFWQLMSYFLGIKVKDTDIEAEKRRLGYDIYYRSRDILSEQRAAEPQARIRSQRASARTRESIRRLGG